jgi:hypothetical protein
LWDGCDDTAHKYGHGLIYCSPDTRKLLGELKLAPDFEDSTGQLDFVHRAGGGSDIYFVRNTSARAMDTIATFRVDGRIPEFWDALDGSITAQQAFTTDQGRTHVPIHLEPFGSIFVVFSQPAEVHVTQVLKDGVESPFTEVVGSEATGYRVQHAEAGTYCLKLSDGRELTLQVNPSHSKQLPPDRWTISFQSGRGAPTGSQPLTSIQKKTATDFRSWSESPMPEVRYFSGTATYRTSVDVQRIGGQRFILILGGLHEICTVRVNGQNLDTLWAMPYRLDITNSLHDGDNMLELEVTNLWPNRIIGDAQPSAIEKYTHTNIRKFTAASPLLPSGLVGSVALETVPPQH